MEERETKRVRKRAWQQMRHKHGVAALSLLLHTEYRAGAASSFISYVPVQRRAAARRAGHEGGRICHLFAAAALV